LYLPRVNRALNLIETGARLALRAGPKSGAKGFTRFDRLVTSTQLRSLLAMADAGNFSLAARAIGISQPSLHRTARDLERLSGIPLFKRVSQGFDLTPSAKILAQHVQLAFSELDQGIEEIESWRGFDTGRVVIGTMPLARTAILPQAINALLNVRPKVDVSVIDGPYDDLLHGLRHGQIDLLIGALRDPLPIGDVVQQPLFSDPLAIVARCGHPLSGRTDLKVEDLAAYPWAVPRTDTPTRDFFEYLISSASARPPAHVIETSSLILMRGLLVGSDRLTIMSAHQMRHEEEQGVLQRLNFRMSATSRNIGITVRINWQPTPTQTLFLDLLSEAGARVHG
jgi:LysR family transcriptional regulator of gallate degradation